MKPVLEKKEGPTQKVMFHDLSGQPLLKVFSGIIPPKALAKRCNFCNYFLLIVLYKQNLWEDLKFDQFVKYKLQFLRFFLVCVDIKIPLLYAYKGKRANTMN
ncbi:hypothetical protein A4244_03295 [Bacillus badius]|nr:hypothetical protein A4244_03295 [Bacillus badius]OCS86105.1 hypothetical protein A6M11_03295 [Bacillus badius]OVE52432.1 hypothetical protein B1A98_08585 [Bacillus badius]TDW04174.1 hypothetical protein B0G66_103475 [Bacillus badius]